MTVKVEYTVPVTGRKVYSGLSADVKPTTSVVAGSEFYESDTKRLYHFTGAGWAWDSSNGSKHTRPLQGTGQLLRGRTIKTAARDTAEWPYGANITHLEVLCWPVVTTALSASIFGCLAVDAPNDTIAGAWLLGTTNIITGLVEYKSSDVHLIPVKLLEWTPIPIESPMVNGAGGGGRVDVRTNDNSTQLNWLIRAS